MTDEPLTANYEKAHADEQSGNGIRRAHQVDAPVADASRLSTRFDMSGAPAGTNVPVNTHAPVNGR